MSASPPLPEGANDIGSMNAQAHPEHYTKAGKLRSQYYEQEMERLQEQLVLLQYWIQSARPEGLSSIFEGRGSGRQRWSDQV